MVSVDKVWVVCGGTLTIEVVAGMVRSLFDEDVCCER